MPELKKLERKFVYSRSGSGSLSVTDEVVFSKPCDFGTALVTFDTWQKLSGSSLKIQDGKEAVCVSIAAGGADFEIRPETIQEDLSGNKEPTRLGIHLTRPVSQAVISLVIAPAE